MEYALLNKGKKTLCYNLFDGESCSFFKSKYINILVAKILTIKVIKQDNAGHKTYIRHIPLTVNSVHRLSRKYT